MTESRVQDVWGEEIVPFTTEEEADIMAWVRQHGRKWRRLLEEGEQVGARTTLSLKHGCFVLDDIEPNEMLARLSELAADMEGLADIATGPMPDSLGDRPDEEEDEEDDQGLRFLEPFCISQRSIIYAQRPDAGGMEIVRILGRQ
jgi:hypothetical protein